MTVATQRIGSPDLSGAARNGIIALLGSGVAAVAGLLLNVVIGRGLGATASGVFFVVVAVLTVASTVSKLGADTGLVWAIARQRAFDRQRDVRATLWVALLPSVLVGLGCALALYAAAPWIAGIIGGAGDLEHLLRVGAPFLVIAGPGMVLAAGLRGVGSIVGYTAVQNVLVPGLRPLLVGAAIAAGLGIGAAVLAWNLPFAVGLIIAALLVARRTRALERLHPQALPASEARTLAREFWRFSAPRAVTAGLEVAIVWADVLIVAALTSPREAGIYAAASRFILTGTLAEGAMRVAMAPEVSRQLAMGNLAAAARLCSAVTQWTVLLSWPLYFGLALYSPAILSVFGTGFSEGATALTILAGAMLIVMSAGNNQTILLMSGRSGLQLANRGIALLGNLLMNLVFVPRWGMDGAATAWAITWVADAVLVLIEVRWAVGVKMSWARVWPVMAMTAIAFVPIGLAARLWSAGAAGSALAATASVVLLAGLLLVNRERLDRPR
jgi:O-antigen/teichoic acid export membrane protein